MQGQDLLNQDGFGENGHPGLGRARVPWLAGRRYGDGVATVVGVGVAVGVEDFDGAI